MLRLNCQAAAIESCDGIGPSIVVSVLVDEKAPGDIVGFSNWTVHPKVFRILGARESNGLKLMRSKVKS